MTLEYIAGFLDADGHVAIVLKGGGQVARKRRHRVYFSLVCGFTNNDLLALVAIKDYLGCRGYVQIVKRQNPRHSPTYHLTYYAHEAAKVLQKLCPHLVVKKSRAKLGLSFQVRKESRGRYHNDDRTSLRRMTPQDHVEDRSFRDQMVSMNGTRATAKSVGTHYGVPTVN